MLPDNFPAFLLFIGSNAFVGILVSKLLNYQKFFQDLDSAAKTNVVMLIHIVLGLASYFLVNNVSPEFIAQVSPVYAIIASIVSQYISSTEYHDGVIAKRENPTNTSTVDLSVKTETSTDTLSKGK